jgi:hypothetical protein
MLIRRIKAALREAQQRLAAQFGGRALLLSEVGATNTLLAATYYQRVMSTPRYQDSTRLVHHGFKVYSQHDEDGVIEEIFRRLGETDRYFVEFGVGDGLENNTLYLLLKGWRGAWIDGSSAMYERVRKNLDFAIRGGQLRVKHAFIRPDNIESLFADLGVPTEFDLLSIDIDFNDYWVWRAIGRYSPRVVAIEYNASLGKTVRCAIRPDPTARWRGGNYFNASLGAMEALGRSKGYTLVGCNFTGVTAFLVRDDLVEDRFLEPFTAENHFEPPRYFVRMPNGHPPDFGPYLLLDEAASPVGGENPARALSVGGKS